MSKKGVTESIPKLSMFCALSQNYQQVFEKWYQHQASWSKLSEKFKMALKCYLALLVFVLFCFVLFLFFWDIDQNVQSIVFINNSRTAAWPTNILKPLFSFSDNYSLQDTCIIFQNSVNYFEIAHKNAQFWFELKFSLYKSINIKS